MTIIGLTGTNAAGKSEIANILKELNYKYFSLSDMIRETAKERNEEPTRGTLIRIGNEFRIKHGPGVWAKELNKKLIHEENKRIVIDSIRHPDEVKELQKLGNFILISVNADVEKRFHRALKRSNKRDPKSPKEFEDFKEKEAQENTTNQNAQQLSATMSLSQHQISNEGSLEDLQNNVLDIIKNLN
jgi:dephospho-CoA kinase